MIPPFIGRSPLLRSMLLSIGYVVATRAGANADDQIVKTTRFGEVRIVQPKSVAEHFVLFLGKGADSARIVDSLATSGAVVAVIDVDAYLKMLSKDEDECVYLAGEFERLGQVLQSASKVAVYRTPIIAGEGRGAAIAYTVAAESPNGFSQGLFYDFCPKLELVKPFCEETEPQRGADGALTAAAHAKTSMLFVGGGCGPSELGSFLAKIPNATRVDSSDVAAQLQALAAKSEPAKPATTVSDLPLIEIREGGGKLERLVVILSGDGGWASIDKALGEYLADERTAVLGFDCLRYFWSKRDPEQASDDLERAIRYHSKRWGVEAITLVGYSYGAQVLPFLFNRMSPAVAAKVESLVLLNPGPRTEFEIHFSDWITDDDEGGVEIKPEVERIRTVPISCIYGVDEDDSLCPMLPTKRVRVVKLPGGHHFDGDYDTLAKVVLEHSKPGVEP